MKLSIKNFRSIKDQTVELAPITVVYGPNAAGKSSLLYALLTLKNIVLNPNQNTAAFFNYNFASIGGFDAVVFDHDTRSEIGLDVALQQGENAITYGVSVGETKGGFRFDAKLPTGSYRQKLSVTFPYSLNQQAVVQLVKAPDAPALTWNGVTAQVQAKAQSDTKVAAATEQFAALVNYPIEVLRRVAVVPLKRGFSKPQYSPVGVSLMISEDEVATWLSAQKYVVSKISHYLEQIFDHDFRVNVKPGTAIFSLDSTDRQTGVATELVNDGFGINQIVYLLARCLNPDSEWVCVEEPEIHLHPSAIRTLVKALTKITREEKKKFVVSTHSEVFLLALLALVAKGEVKTDDLACYLVRKDRKVSVFDRQEVNAKGQISGGLASFMEGEQEDIEAFLAADKK